MAAVLMGRLAILIPTRGRPANVERLLRAVEETAESGPSLFFRVDDDDPCLPEYQDVVSPSDLWIGPRNGLCAATNELAVQHADDFEWLGSFGDDHLPRTPGWDAKIIEALERQPLGIVYGDDTIQGERIPTAAFMDARIVRVLGWMAPPAMLHLYIDDSWRELGQALGTLTYLPEVVIEHLHPAGGKAEMDATYAEGTTAAVWDHDEPAFNAWVAEGLPAAVEALRAALP